MRTLVAAALLLVPAACGDDSGSMVSADVAAEDVAGASCVVPASGAQRTALTWTVRKGDTLRDIARRLYGDEDLWTGIRDANPGKVGRSGEVQAGVELTIPFEGL